MAWNLNGVAFTSLIESFIRSTAPPAEFNPEGFPSWMVDKSDRLLEGNLTIAERVPGFLWRGGRERTTTGIWMYGKVFARRLPDTKERVAVVLMDTQGM